MRYLFTILALMLSGCATTPRVSVDRKVYHTIASASQFAGKTYAIEFIDPAQANSLEMKTHSEVLATFMSRYRMKRLSGPEAKNADYIVRINFGIGKENKVASSSTPNFVTTGGTSNFSTTTYGARGPATTFGSVNTTPGVQVAGSSTSTYTYTEYTRAFTLTIHDSSKVRDGDNVPIYEGLALSEGASNDTTRLFPCLISALMHDFPSKSGEMERGIEFELW